MMTAHLPGHVVLDLLVEQMYYRSAITAVSQAEELASRIASREGQLSWLVFAEAYDLGDEIDPSEEDFRQWNAAEEDLRRQFGLFLQALVVTHVLSTMTFEAYVNRVASDHLSRRYFDAFDRLSLDAKWLFLPRLLAKDSFDPGSEPFQGFALLLRRRNRLVHAKASDLAELLLPDRSVDDLMQEGVRDAHESIRTVAAMASRLSEFLSLPSPEWLSTEEGEPFHVHYGA